MEQLVTRCQCLGSRLQVLGEAFCIEPHFQTASLHTDDNSSSGSAIGSSSSTSSSSNSTVSLY